MVQHSHRYRQAHHQSVFYQEQKDDPYVSHQLYFVNTLLQNK
jgi:lipoprotein NlpI